MRTLIRYQLRIDEQTVVKLSSTDYAKLEAKSQAGDFILDRSVNDFRVDNNYTATRHIHVTLELGKP